MSTKCTTPLLVSISVAITFADSSGSRNADLIETPLPLLITSIWSSERVVTVVIPLGISPAMILLSKTCLKRTAANASLFSGSNKNAMVPGFFSSSLSNAAFVGANTVKSPLPLSVSAKPAALTAVNNVERSAVAAAVSAIVF